MNLFNIAEAAEYLNVSKMTLRLWDKNGKLSPQAKTVGGHRRYTKEQLDQFLNVEEKNNLGTLYDALCAAQYIADKIGDDHAEQLLNIRQEVGEALLNEHMLKVQNSK